MPVIDNDITGYAWTTYLKSCHCCDCNNRIEAGQQVWGICYDGRSLTHRICKDCHNKKEDRILVIP